MRSMSIHTDGVDNPQKRGEIGSPRGGTAGSKAENELDLAPAARHRRVEVLAGASEGAAIGSASSGAGMAPISANCPEKPRAIDGSAERAAAGARTQRIVSFMHAASPPVVLDCMPHSYLLGVRP